MVQGVFQPRELELPLEPPILLGQDLVLPPRGLRVLGRLGRGGEGRGRLVILGDVGVHLDQDSRRGPARGVEAVDFDRVALRAGDDRARSRGRSRGGGLGAARKLVPHFWHRIFLPTSWPGMFPFSPHDGQLTSAMGRSPLRSETPARPARAARRREARGRSEKTVGVSRDGRAERAARSPDPRLTRPALPTNIIIGSMGFPPTRPGRARRGCGHIPFRYSWTNWTDIEPSPTADATRLTELARASPAAKTPGRLDSRETAAGERSRRATPRGRPRS